MKIRPKLANEIDTMREGGRILHTILAETDHFIRQGLTLREIDHFIQKNIESHAASPSFLGYKNYPSSACLSVNDAVVHGLPNNYVLEEGDIIGVDVGVAWQGYHTDAAFTKAIGSIDPQRKKLLAVTQEALRVGIEAAIAGNTVSDIGQAIESYVHTQGNYGIIRDLSGHGIGIKLQEEPEVPNYATHDSTPLVNNMTLAIEPMISLGDWRVKLRDDAWTVITADGSPSAHFETTVVIRDNDPEVLVSFPLDYSC